VTVTLGAGAAVPPACYPSWIRLTQQPGCGPKMGIWVVNLGVLADLVTDE